MAMTAGNCTAVRGCAVIQYQYDAEWDTTGQRVVWTARVRVLGSVLERLIKGEFPLNVLAQPEPSVRSMIERAIERGSA